MRRGFHGRPDAEPERLQKVLARLGLASRREAEEWIRAGRVSVNGHVATLGERVKPGDQLRLDGRPIRQRAPSGGQAFIAHRSPGEPLSLQDEEARHEPVDDRDESDLEADGASRGRSARPTIALGGSTHEEATAGQALLERLPRRAGRRFIVISPMPRIDGGLELITSDGELAARLQRLIHRLESEFSVRIRGALTDPQRQGVLDGLLDRGVRLEVQKCEEAGGGEESANRWYTVTARGGSGKDVRQLFERQGVVVSRVLRTRIGPLALSRDLTRGHFRRLEPKEIEALTGAPPSDAQELPEQDGKPRGLRRARATAPREAMPERRGKPEKRKRPGGPRPPRAGTGRGPRRPGRR